jgi:putative ABC transport system ATP-binding protein
MALIETSKLTRLYRLGGETVHALREITLSIDEGDFVAVMGPSGSGKSTFMNVIGCLDRPTSGSYRLDGETVSTLSGDALAAIRNRKLGFVFQQFHLLDRANAVRNVTLPLLYAEVSRDGTARAERALEAVGLAHRKHYLPSELSGGEQQRVAIARALINDPPLILADEATGNLDAASGAEVLDIFRSLVRGGRTIVLITHDRSVAHHADRILGFSDGRVAGNEIGMRGRDTRPGTAAPGP